MTSKASSSGTASLGSTSVVEPEPSKPDLSFLNTDLFPTHMDFIEILRDAQTSADVTKSKVPISWRGYHSSVFPDLPKFTGKEFKNRLTMALRGVCNITLKERQVIEILNLKKKKK